MPHGVDNPTDQLPIGKGPEAQRAISSDPQQPDRAAIMLARYATMVAVFWRFF